MIAGDVIGSVLEHALTKSTDFPLFDPLGAFTDDAVLTAAIRIEVESPGLRRALLPYLEVEAGRTIVQDLRVEFDDFADTVSRVD